MTAVEAARDWVDDFVQPDFHQVELDIETYLKKEKGWKLDADRQICRDNLTPEGCPLGPAACPLRHTTPSDLNFIPPPPQPTHPKDREKVNTVCKHYLRGLCIMGKNCEFLHEYNLRKFPECWWYGTYGFCAVGDECLYYHPKVRARECEDYNRGFCVLGPDCPRKHIRRVLCMPYIAGFCPDGPDCRKGHPRPDLPGPSAYEPPDPPLAKDIGPAPPGYGRYHDYDPFNPQAWQVWDKGPQGAAIYGDRGGGAGGTAAAAAAARETRIKPGMKGWKEGKELEGILCFRCDQYGHYASHCPNPAKPGDRGGLQRRR